MQLCSQQAAAVALGRTGSEEAVALGRKGWVEAEEGEYC